MSAPRPYASDGSAKKRLGAAASLIHVGIAAKRICGVCVDGYLSSSAQRVRDMDWEMGGNSPAICGARARLAVIL